MDAVVALLPFAADACLVASSFEADADDADDAAELADDAAAVLRILHGFPTLSRSFRIISLRKLNLALRWPVQWLGQPSLWLLKQTMRHFLPIFRRRWHWLRPARHLLTRHWRRRSRCFEPAAAEALCPAAVSEDPAFVSTFCRLRGISCRRCRGRSGITGARGCARF